MGESFDIQNLLQAGYFTTSRAKSPKPPSSPKLDDRPSSQPPPSQQPPYQLPYYPLIPRPRSAAPARVPRVRPPPPSVEDEEVSLKREHGVCLAKYQEEEPPSRGDIEQNPMIMEVHEYNPERRFVILTGSSSGSEGGEAETRVGSDRRRGTERRREEERRNEPSRRPEPERRAEPEIRNETKPPRTDRFEKAQRNERLERQDRPSGDAYTDTRSSRRYDSNLKADATTSRERSRPPLEKRRSRQDLPRLETEFRDDQLPEKYRTRPSAPASGRHDQPPARPPKIPLDPQLAPEVIKSSASGRDQAYYGQSQSASRRSPTRPGHVSSAPNERRYDNGHTRTSSTASTSKRTNVETEKPTRPLSKERVGDASARPLSKDRDEQAARPLSKERVGTESSYRGDYLPRSTKKDRSPSYGRTDREDFGRSSTYPPREPTREPTIRRDDRGDDNRSGDDHPKGPRELHPRRKKSVVLQDERESQPKLEKVDAPSGPRLRPGGATMPIPVVIPTGSVVSDDFTQNLRPASTFPVARDRHVLPERPKNELPYPVDEDTLIDPFDTRGKSERIGRPRSQYEPDPIISMPEMPTPIAIGPEIPLEARPASAISSATRSPASSQSWQPPTFDPNRDGVRLEKPVGSVRRHSEHQEATGVTTFPECRRKHPVAGLVDWLTLPRTEFNICPDCYGSVFAKTEYRKPFQPMLRPTAQAIACDFGVGPWYRIAWLLTLKNEVPNLRLFHEVAKAISTTYSLPCPVDRVTTRNWLTLWNPYTRQPVYDFTICPQCAHIIQALFPNLTGIFIPLDSRSEPTRGLCAMRFKPTRKRFVMYFDAMETTSDQARLEQEEPDLDTLAQEVEKMAAVSECQEDKPITNGYWHIMQYLRQFSVCGECFDEVVRPLIKDDNVIARNFYMKPQKLPLATCQLYSNRMREIFRKACRWNDPKYLEAKVLERMDVEAMIHEKLAKLDRSKHEDEDWVEEQVDNLATSHSITNFDAARPEVQVSTFAMASRPTVSIIGKDGAPTGATHAIPAVFTSPIRPDIVQQVHTGIAKNKRQPYAVSEKAGHQTSAESWGTGRAVARIPRVSGGGTHRAGQAAFGNMCRSGRMFAPTKIWRKWHIKVNQGQKRYAVVSALAASAAVPLLQARGHQVNSVPEVPLVVDSAVFEGAAIAKTAAAFGLLKAVGAGPDIEKVKGSKKLRAGKGKLRGRRHRQRRGPLVIYDPETDGKELVTAFRNITGVETSPVTALNLLQLAPGGHLGRFIVWTSAAFKALDEIYGSTTEASAHKRDFLLPSNIVSQADLTRLINSSEIQSSLNAPKGDAVTRRSAVQKKNPLKNKQVMLRLNPYASVFAQEAQKKQN
ncbi:hypothetical protein H9Q69_004081 [Fusarium xylarioides]|nr:hypothetical protein H9Q69_004081 [Fusarium xylarioides]